MDKFTIPLLKDNFYHVYNRANSGRRIFHNDENYDFFLQKFGEYLSEFVELFAFCLLPSHFHMLIRVIRENSDLSGSRKLKGLSKGSISISRAFSNFFNSYSKSLNKQENRFGNLFQRPFKRIALDKEEYLLSVIYYIHQNPVHHGLCDDFTYYKWSSYYYITREVKSLLNSEEVLNWFGGMEEFKEIHKSMLINYKENFIIE
jgi:REP element-mobilizing transposase RayT